MDASVNFAGPSFISSWATRHYFKPNKAVIVSPSLSHRYFNQASVIAKLQFLPATLGPSVNFAGPPGSHCDSVSFSKFTAIRQSPASQESIRDGLMDLPSEMTECPPLVI